MSGLAVEFGAVGALSDTSDRPERLDKDQSAALGNAAVALPTHPAGSANLAPLSQHRRTCKGGKSRVYAPGPAVGVLVATTDMALVHPAPLTPSICWPCSAFQRR